MILVFGGTTEGRMAVEVLEEGGSSYFYSTRDSRQEVKLTHGIRLTGGKDTGEIVAFCREHGVRLLVDATHPFAVEVHQNICEAARQLQLPVIRYERIFEEHTDGIVWCDDYDDAIRRLEGHGVDKLLALTGVQTMGKLLPYWQNHECWFRILDRDASRKIAGQFVDFPEDHLVYYEHEDTHELIGRLHPHAILTKESGRSGGFLEKEQAARMHRVPLFAIRRPPYPAYNLLLTVDGPNGLRREVERLLPSFYPLHSGLTTGTCATAAAIAATLLLNEDRKELPQEVSVVLPNGETIHVPVQYGDGYASCFKDAGDDPDVTNGIEVRASVEPSDHFQIVGGDGVGRFTLPGFDFPPGEPAINKGPREMMRRNIQENVRVTISVPHGEETAQRTFNPRLGIEGGISIIGVSGIVKPFSEEAFIESIRKCMVVAKASGADRVVINSGAKSERFVRALYPTLPRQAFVEYGNYIGETLKMADELGFAHVTLGVMLGKAVKLAAGHLDTHSRRATMDKQFIRQMLLEAGCEVNISDITLARELWERMSPLSIEAFANVVIRHCEQHCCPLLPNGSLTILLIDDEGRIYQLRNRT